MNSVTRRVFVRTAALAASMAPLLSWLELAHGKEAQLGLGKPRPFSFEALTERARLAAAKPYKPPYRPAPQLVKKLNYEEHGKIHFKIDRALDGKGPGVYPTTFFHLGEYFPKSVKMHALRAGQAREILYAPDDFEMPADSIARKLPRDSGFAGFHLHESRRRADWKTQDWVAFLGASYLRAIGSGNQYGISARGICVNATASTPEEFPDFTEFYLESPLAEGEPMNVYALLDGPSLCGAYRFQCKRTEGVVMDVECALFLRSDIAQLGISPLTSMFWYSEYDKKFRIDWRPEVHDSDGLALWTAAGERMFRPLNNPSRVITSSFAGESPRGFGLVQRDRVADHYLDGVNYERRPSLWVEPVGDWGAGAVQLIEIPTDDEIHDNVVAFWVPAGPAQRGASYRYKYRLFWQADEPYPAGSNAVVVATRIGRGGQPGKPRPPGVTKFVVEFAGKVLGNVPRGAAITACVTASRGTISGVFTEPVPSTPRIRAQFDLAVTGNEPIELRLFLQHGEQTLSETWACQFEPRS
ncbi:MAG: glucan biosynthesis protein [Myxococcaceae bacterium]|nr:glucan biosynthesis protein [Myxococcaceae bacterium]